MGPLLADSSPSMNKSPDQPIPKMASSGAFFFAKKPAVYRSNVLLVRSLRQPVAEYLHDLDENDQGDDGNDLHVGLVAAGWRGRLPRRR